MHTLLIDNYDSFTFNLAQYLQELGARLTVVKNDELTLEAIRALAPERIVISPGPGTVEQAADFGVCEAVIRELAPQVPLLGVCLGHQGIVKAFGGGISHAPEVVHGKTRPVQHDGRGLFAGLPNPMPVMRYHSLVASEVPACLEVSARSDDDLVMAVRHREHPIFGIQFHPESIGTPDGKALLKNFLGLNYTMGHRIMDA